MKIGITCCELYFPDNKEIFGNGHRYNVLLWYYFLVECGFDVFYLSNKMETKKVINSGYEYNIINYEEWFTNIDKLYEYKPDVVLTAGLADKEFCQLLKKHNIKCLYSMMGNNYTNDIESVVYNTNYNTETLRDTYDEIWISPHFGYSIEYYKIRYNTDNIHVGPYLWREDLIKGHNVLKYTQGEKIIAGICEPNVSDKKNSMIPLCICEKSKQYIDFVRCYGTAHIRQNSFFASFVSNLELYKESKMVFNNRNIITDIFKKCNCIISTTQECELNYVFLECFYYGIPLIHNSKMLQEYGYYYPDLDINKAVEQVKQVFNTHNTKLYIEKHKPILHKYSISNPYNQEWVRNKLCNA